MRHGYTRAVLAALLLVCIASAAPAAGTSPASLDPSGSPVLASMYMPGSGPGMGPGYQPMRMPTVGVPNYRPVTIAPVRMPTYRPVSMPTIHIPTYKPVTIPTVKWPTNRIPTAPTVKIPTIKVPTPRITIHTITTRWPGLTPPGGGGPHIAPDDTPCLWCAPTVATPGAEDTLTDEEIDEYIDQFFAKAGSPLPLAPLAAFAAGAAIAAGARRRKR